MWPPLRDGLVQNLSGDRGHAEIGQNEGIAALGKHGEGFTTTPGRVRVIEAHLSRQLYQALHELEAMRAGRRGQAAPLVRVDVQGAPDLIAAAGALTP